MTLLHLVWGGSIYNATTGGAKIEEWACSMSMVGLVNMSRAQVLASSATARTAVENFHIGVSTFISNTVALEWLKFNAFDISTGKQITDPTVETFITPGIRGANNSNSPPLFTSLKVSMDASTRLKREKGGFYVPRFAAFTGLDGTYSQANCESLRGNAATMISTLEADANIEQVGVWSRRYKSFASSNRLRVGNVPDFMSSRKRSQIETYYSTSI
jgi:hypothetical protein